MQLEKINDSDTFILITPEEFKKLCKPGEEKNTCIWAVCGSKGFECTCLNRPATLVTAWKSETTHAKRDGCEYVNNLLSHKDYGEHFPLGN